MNRKVHVHWRWGLLGGAGSRSLTRCALLLTSTVACPATFLPPNWLFFHFALNTCRQQMQVLLYHSKNRYNTAYFHKSVVSFWRAAPQTPSRASAMDPTGTRPPDSHSCPPTLNDLTPRMRMWPVMSTVLYTKTEGHIRVTGIHLQVSAVADEPAWCAASQRITANVLQTKVDDKCDKRVIRTDDVTHDKVWVRLSFTLPCQSLTFHWTEIGCFITRQGRDAQGNTPTMGVLPHCYMLTFTLRLKSTL